MSNSDRVKFPVGLATPEFFSDWNKKLLSSTWRIIKAEPKWQQQLNQIKTGILERYFTVIVEVVQNKFCCEMKMFYEFALFCT